jgi:diguanylate cyclase (GGDEF)-like protein/PAS domain S-box-containing protein
MRLPSELNKQGEPGIPGTSYSSGNQWAQRYLDAVDDLVIMVEADTGMISSVNPAAARRLQEAGIELVGSYVMKLVFHDDRHAVADALVQTRLAHLQNLAKLTSDIFLVTDFRGTILETNPAASRLHGVPMNELVGRSARELVHPDGWGLYDAIPRSLAENGGVGRWSIPGLRADGSRVELDCITTIDAVEQRAYTVERDVTDEVERSREVHALAAELRRRAENDLLNGLANRSAFESRLTAKLAAGAPVAVAFLDLDNFKSVNDSLGHATGDALLQKVADRLRGCIRESDLAARFGGDEFCIMLSDIEPGTSLELFARVITGAVNEPMLIAGRKMIVSCSVGISSSDQRDSTAETMMKRADAAAYKAKDLGRNQYVVFDHELQRRMTSQFEMESQLHAALDDGGSDGVPGEHGVLDVDVQGIFDTDRNLVAVEALVRWDHPTRGRLLPAEFLDVADAAGLMGRLGDQVIARSFEAVGPWLRREPNATLSINLSPRMDDFGKGASSLGHLRDLPFEVVKIDRGFIDCLGTDPVNTAIVESVIGLSRRLGMTVVAEGIESEQHVRVLGELGCDLLQGFYLHRPEPALTASVLGLADSPALLP